MTDLKKIEEEALLEVLHAAESYDKAALYNTEKVMQAFRKHMVSDFYLKPTTGYAYSDVGREKLDEIYADIFKTEAALVRSQFVSGTHALAVALLGVLKAGDEVIAATGAPYDTMQTIIGVPVKTPGSLTDLGVVYKEIPMIGSQIDLEKITAAITAKTKMIHIQRSCGYSSVRKTLRIEEIGTICKAAKAIKPDIICFVDNCYGEFIEKQEPTEVGADLMAGSLIKNPGGGIAPTGGYIAGRADLVDAAADYLTAPGLGGELGSYAYGYRLFFQGFFMAPHVTAQAIKGAVFAAAVFDRIGFHVSPAFDEPRSDLIQTIYLENEKNMCLFAQGIQTFSPVDAHVTPIPDDMPGYADKIIMAAGDFVQGSSIELSADGPIREPYMIYLQGGIVFEHNVLAVLSAARYILENK